MLQEGIMHLNIFNVTHAKYIFILRFAKDYLSFVKLLAFLNISIGCLLAGHKANITVEIVALSMHN